MSKEYIDFVNSVTSDPSKSQIDFVDSLMIMEEQGADFSAKMAGKLKMVFQCISVIVSLCLLATNPDSTPAWLLVAAQVAAWVAVLSTVYSGAGYVIFYYMGIDTDGSRDEYFREIGWPADRLPGRPGRQSGRQEDRPSYVPEDHRSRGRCGGPAGLFRRRSVGEG